MADITTADLDRNGLESDLYNQISMIRQMNVLTSEFGPMLDQIAGALGNTAKGPTDSRSTLQQQLTSLIGSIPNAPTLDLNSIMANAGKSGFGFGSLLQGIDPQVAAFSSDQCCSGSCTNVSAAFDKAFSASPISSLLQPFREYVQSVQRVTGHPTNFALSHAKLSARVMLHKTTDPAPFNDPATIFAQYEDLKKTFTFDGRLPVNGLSGRAKDVADSIAQAEAKLSSWQQNACFVCS